MLMYFIFVQLETIMEKAFCPKTCVEGGASESDWACVGTCVEAVLLVAGRGLVSVFGELLVVGGCLVSKSLLVSGG